MVELKFRVVPAVTSVDGTTVIVAGKAHPPDPDPLPTRAGVGVFVTGAVDGPVDGLMVVGAVVGGALDGTGAPDRFTKPSVVVLVGIVGAGEGPGATGAVVPPGVVMTADAVAVGATTVMAATVSAPSARRRRVWERAWGQ